MYNTPTTRTLTKIVYIILISGMTTLASASSKPGNSPYQGQEKRQIKSLSESDINSLRNGQGWGLAKAAELNGMPGPSHILQLKNDLRLRADQEQKVSKLYNEMKRKAIDKGLQLIELEQRLEIAFQNKTITNSSLLKLLTQISEVRRDLRFIHLSSHLETPLILDKDQIALYNKLRGYSSTATKAAPNADSDAHHHQH